jgi:hypothetical protein
MYYVTEILWRISEWGAADVPESGRKLTAHADNAQPHIRRLSGGFSEGHRMKTAPDPPYSLDIALSDFYLFGYVKGCVVSPSFVDADELCEAVRGILNSTQKVTLQAVFLELMDRLRTCIQVNSESTK